MLSITVDTFVDEMDGSIVDGDVSLRDAIALAPAGETIDFAPSLDGGTILLLLGELDVNDSLTIDASSLPNGLTIDASTNDPTPGVPQGDGIRVFNIDDGNASNHLDVVIRGLTITGGDTREAGGGIRSAENLTVDDSLITGNLTANNPDCYHGGGGIHAEGQTTIITSSTISNNTSVVCPGGGMSVTTSGSGSTTTISDTTFSGNSVLVFASGGGVFAFTDSGGTLTISNSTFTDNSDDGVGGAVFAVAIGSGSENEITSSDFTGSLDSIQVETWAGATTVISQTDAGRGIAVYTEGNSTTTISDSVVGFIASNTMNGGNTTISHTVVQDGISASTQESGTTTINSSTVSGSQGIGITSETYGSEAQTIVDSSTITGNLGGGIFAESYDGGTTTIVNSTISGNSSNLRSGGVYAYTDGGTLEIRHSTIVGNIADADYDGSGSGGGIYSDGPDPPILDHTIVAGNVRATGASTHVDEDIVGSVDMASAYNLVGVDTGLAGISNGDNGNQVGTAATPLNVNLGPLKNNGGPSHTHVVLAGSPALDTGDPAFVPPPAVDQRGHPRVVDGDNDSTPRIDIGAFEKDTLLGDMDRNGIFDLDDVAFFVLALNNPAQYELDFGVATSLHGDIDQDGDLDLDDVDPFVELLTNNAAEGSGAGLPTTITVNTLLDTIDGNTADGVISLRDAITVATGGETIDFDLSLDGGTITLTFGQLDVDESLLIDASGLPAGLTVDASGNDPTPSTNIGDGSRVLQISDNDPLNHIDVEIRGLTLTGGDSDSPGGGVHSAENLTLTDTVISGNSAFDAGGGLVVYNNGNSASIHSSTISDNSLISVGQTYLGGAGVFAFNYGSNSSTTITSSTISGNSASGTIINAVGGGVTARLGDGAGLFIASSTISGNSQGAGIDVLAYYGTGNTTTISSSTVSGNTGGAVGGVSVSARNGDTTTIESTTVADNSGFAVGGVATTTGVGSTTTIDSSTVSGNSGNSIGGISATNDGGGTTAIRSSTISGNAGGFIGGVRANNDGGDFQIRHSTVAGNVADADYSGSGSGGGIFIDGPDSPTLYHTLVAENVRATGASSSIADDIFGSVDAASSFNLVGVDTGMTGISDGTGGNQVGTAASPIDARLGPLKNNGGPTRTHVVLAGSPALDAGDPSLAPAPDFDQRGHARVVDGDGDSTARIDIGAFEKDTLLGDMNLDGRRDLDDVDFYVLGLSAPAQYELDIGIASSLHGDIDQDGDLDVDDVDPYVNLLVGGSGNSTAKGSAVEGGGAGSAIGYAARAESTARVQSVPAVPAAAIQDAALAGWLSSTAEPAAASRPGGDAHRVGIERGLVRPETSRTDLAVIDGSAAAVAPTRVTFPGLTFGGPDDAGEAEREDILWAEPTDWLAELNHEAPAALYKPRLRR